MKKRGLIEFFNGILIPTGSTNEKNNWITENDQLIKVVNLQKSNFSNTYYINYGFIIKGLQLTTITHVSNRLHGNDQTEGKKINDLLSLDNNIDDSTRLLELKEIVMPKVLDFIISINTEQDLKMDLKKRPHLNDIPIVVHKHFNL